MSLFSLFVQCRKINVTVGVNKTKTRLRQGGNRKKKNEQVSMARVTTVAGNLCFDSQCGRGQNGYSDLLFIPTNAQYINNKICIVIYSFMFSSHHTRTQEASHTCEDCTYKIDTSRFCRMYVQPTN